MPAPGTSGIAPTLRLTGYQLVREVQPIDADAIDVHFAALADQHATWNAISGTPQAGDRVRMLVAFGPVGAPVDELERYEDHFIIAGGRADPAVERHLSTMMVGDSLDLPTLTMDTGEARTLHVQLTLTFAERKTLVVVDDAFIRRVVAPVTPWARHVRRVADYRALLYRRMRHMRESEADQRVREQLLEQIARAHPHVPADPEVLEALTAPLANDPRLAPNQRVVLEFKARERARAVAVLDCVAAELPAESQPRAIPRGVPDLPKVRRHLGREAAVRYLLDRNPVAVAPREMRRRA